MSGNRPEKVWENISVGEMKGSSPLAEFISCGCAYCRSSESGAPRAIKLSGPLAGRGNTEIGDEVGCPTEWSSWLR